MISVGVGGSEAEELKIHEVTGLVSLSARNRGGCFARALGSKSWYSADMGVAEPRAALSRSQTPLDVRTEA